jgi:GxxExxY protein
MEHEELTQIIIGCGYKVSNALGSGFVEKVYENALAHEIYKSGLKVQQQYQIKVFYDGIVIGEFAPDLLVAEKVLVELKAVRELDEIHMAQAMNYLKASGLQICLLINFGKPKVEIRRLVPYEIWQGKKPEILRK